MFVFLHALKQQGGIWAQISQHTCEKGANRKKLNNTELCGTIWGLDLKLINEVSI